MTGIALNNTGGDEVKLYSVSGSVLDQVSYPGSAQEDMSYAKNEDGNWVWTNKLTAGSKNIIEGKSAAPLIAIDADTEVAVNEWVTFDASDTVSPEGKKLSFNWDFADGSDDEGASVEHKFKEEGVYSVVLKVDDGTQSSEKEIIVTGRFLRYGKNQSRLISGSNISHYGEVCYFLLINRWQMITLIRT